MGILVVCSIFILLSRESVMTLAFYFGRIRIRLGVVHFQDFRLFDFSVNLLLVPSHQTRDNNHRQAPYTRA